MTLRELLITGAHELGIALGEKDVERFFSYVSELKKWNSKINLTAIREDREIIIKHLLDSLSYLKGFTPSPGLEMMDMGSGAGFPAIPLKMIHPELAVTLVESVKKKASFLRHLVRTLQLRGIDVLDVRTDDLPAEFRSRFHVVTARAFADMATALSKGTPFLKPGGLMVLSRGPEETIADSAREAAGVVQENRISLTLPYANYPRVIWVFKKPA